MKYQEKEYYKAKNKYDTEEKFANKTKKKLIEKRLKAKAAGKSKKADKLKNKIVKNDKYWNERKKVIDRTLDNIKNMKVDDMNREKRIKGVAIAGSILSMMGAMSMANLTGYGFWVMASPSGMVSSDREKRAEKEIRNRNKKIE